MTFRVVVTGATGFVGANLTRRLLAEGHEVHLLLRAGYSPWRIDAVRNRVHLHLVDLTDRRAIEEVLRAIVPRWIFHLAVHGAYSSQRDTEAMVRTNVIGTINLVDAAAEMQVDAFVNTGSSSEYGFKDHAPEEQEWLEPNSAYAVTKAAATHYCRYVAATRDLWVPTLRLYSVYGPYEEPTRLIPTLLTHAAGGHLPPLVNPNVARDYVYVDDVLDAYLAAAAQPQKDRGAVYNVGTGIQTSLREIVHAVMHIFGVQVQPVWGSMPDRDWDSAVWVANSARIARELGWRASTGLKEGLGATASWLSAARGMEEYYRASQRASEQAIRGSTER